MCAERQILALAAFREPVAEWLELVATCRLADGPHLGTENWRLNGDKGSSSDDLPVAAHLGYLLEELGFRCRAAGTSIPWQANVTHDDATLGNLFAQHSKADGLTLCLQGLERHSPAPSLHGSCDPYSRDPVL